MFRAIASDKFPPFGQLRLELPAVPDKPGELAEVHLFTGVNGTGKTRLLSILCAMLGNNNHLKKRLKGTEATTVSATSTFVGFNNIQAWPRIAAASDNIGWQSVDVMTQWANSVPAFAYSGNAYVADAQVAAMVALKKPERIVCLSFNRPEDTSTVLLQAVTNLLLEAAMDSLDDPDPKNASRARRMIKSLESTLSQITGMKF